MMHNIFVAMGDYLVFSKFVIESFGEDGDSLACNEFKRGIKM